MSNLYSLKFYANCPDGQIDKLFTYPVHHGGHAFDLLRRFFAKGFDVRAAFIEVQGERSSSAQLVPYALVQLASGGSDQEARVRAELLTKYPAREESDLVQSSGQ